MDNNLRNDNLPQGWLFTSLGMVADYINGRAFKPTEWKNEGKPIIRIQNLNNHTAKFNYSPLAHEEKYIIKNGDLLFAWSASLGAYIWHGQEAWLNQHIFKIQSYRCIDKIFLYYLLVDVTAKLYAKTHGSGMVHVTKGKFEETEIVLPPISEQHRIVAKIDSLFSELDNGIESLKTAREQLKIYRQALLKHAFSGKLTEQWRAENQDKLETAEALLKRIQAEREQCYQQQIKDWEVTGKQGIKPKAPKILAPLTAEELAELPELPKEWIWVRPEDICSPEPYSIGIGPFGSNLKVSDYRESGIPLIFVRNITRSNFLLALKYIDEVKFQELIPHSVNALDLVITKMGDPPGDCEIYPENAPTAVLTADCLKFRLWEKFANRKLYKFSINSNLVKRQLGLITKGVAQKKISVESFKTVCLPLLSVEEQQVLVQEIDSKLSVCDQLDQTLSTALQQAEALRLSILKKAFSGQLVPQDSNDEPASVLLERIQAEKVKSITLAPVSRGKKSAIKHRSPSC